MLRESGLIYTQCGSMCMCAAAIEDYAAWCFLIIALSMVHAEDMFTALYVFLSVLSLALGLFFFIRPILNYWVNIIETWASECRMKGHQTAAYLMHKNLFVFIICLVYLTSFTTALLGVHSIFGAFLFGLIVPRGTRLYKDCNDYLEEFTMSLLLPLYFALSGLNTDITKINSGKIVGITILVTVTAIFGKFLGCGGAALAIGFGFREASVIAVLMNTRGLVELIVLNIGLENNILNQASKYFCRTVSLLARLINTCFYTCACLTFFSLMPATYITCCYILPQHSCWRTDQTFWKPGDFYCLCDHVSSHNFYDISHN